MSTFGFMLGVDDSLRVRAIKVQEDCPGVITFDDGRDTGYVFDRGEPLEGGSAIVYKVRNPGLSKDEEYALKILLVDVSSDAAKLRWSNETQNLAKLDNCKYVPAIKETGTIQRLPAIIMKWAKGETLQSRIDCIRQSTGGLRFADLRRSVENANNWVAQICTAMGDINDELRRKGWHNAVHGDLKPGNIQIESVAEPLGVTDAWRTWILDFGEFHIGKSELLDTRCEGLTYRYASPEILRRVADQNAALDSRSDQYQVGICLCELLDAIDCQERGPKETHAGGYPGLLPRSRRSPASECIVRQGRLLLRRFGTLKIRNARQVARRMTAWDPDDRYKDFRRAASDLLKPFRATLRRNWAFCCALLAAVIIAASAVAYIVHLSKILDDSGARLSHLSTSLDDSDARVEALSRRNDRLESENVALENIHAPVAPPVAELTPGNHNEVENEWRSYIGDSSLTNVRSVENQIYSVTFQKWKNQFGEAAAKKMTEQLQHRVQALNGKPIQLKLLRGHVRRNHAGKSATLKIIINGKQIVESTAVVDADGVIEFSDLPIAWSIGQSPVEFQCVIPGSLYGSYRVSPLDPATGAFSLLTAFGCSCQDADGAYSGNLPGNDDWDWTARITVAK